MILGTEIGLFVELPDTLICNMVRVFGPYPGKVLGAPPEDELSGSPVYMS